MVIELLYYRVFMGIRLVLGLISVLFDMDSFHKSYIEPAHYIGYLNKYKCKENYRQIIRRANLILLIASLFMIFAIVGLGICVFSTSVLSTMHRSIIFAIFIIQLLFDILFMMKIDYCLKLFLTVLDCIVLVILGSM